MTTRRGTLDVDGRPTTWLRRGACDGTVVLFAHGAGAPLTSDWMAAVTDALVAHGLCVARFHFPYMHRAVTEGRRRPPDRAPVCVATWHAMIARAASWKGVERIVVTGKSMGARMGTMALAERDEPAPVVGVVSFGYPLHPPGKPERLRSAHLADVGVPQLFVSGTRDPLCDLALLRRELAGVPAACLELVDGGDHSLVRTRRELPDAETPWIGAAVDAIGGWR